MSGILYEQRAFATRRNKVSGRPSTIRTCGNASRRQIRIRTMTGSGSAKVSPDMNFYLVRHGDAVAVGGKRRASALRIGREQVQRAAREMLERGSKVSRIYHSGILRAEQTAEILAKAFPPNSAVEQHAGLLPEDDPAIVSRSLTPPSDSIMLVGHLPYLKRLAALLISGDPESRCRRFSARDCALLFLRRRTLENQLDI